MVQILDLGCGLGNNAIYLGSKGLKVLGVDFSADAVREANRRLKEAGSPATENVTFQLADALRLEHGLAGQQFDCLLDSALLHALRPAAQVQYVRSITPYVRLVASGLQACRCMACFHARAALKLHAGMGRMDASAQ